MDTLQRPVGDNTVSPQPAAPLFIADVHLGKLAKALRLLGFDTLYSNAFTAAQLLTLARAQHRAVLSRGTAFRKHPDVTAVIIQSEKPDEQLLQVVQQFDLAKKRQPFSRCLVCNGLLAPVAKEKIAAQLQENTALYFNEFWQCTACKRIYWKGSHYDRMFNWSIRLNK